MILIYAHTNNVKRMGAHMNYGHKRTGAKVSKRTMFISGTLSAALLFGGATFVAHEAMADQGKSFSEIAKQVQGYDARVLHPDATPQQLKDLYPGSTSPQASFAGLARQIQLYDAAVLHPDADDAKLKQLYPQANIKKADVTEFKAQLQKEAAAQHQEKFNRNFKSIAKQVLKYDIEQLHPNATPEELQKLYPGKLTDEIAQENKGAANTKDAHTKEESTKQIDVNKDTAINDTKAANTVALASEQSLTTAPDDAQAASTKLARTGDMPLAAIPVVGAVVAGAVLFMRSRFVR